MPPIRNQIVGKSPIEVVRLVQNSIFEQKCQPLEEYESYSRRLSRGEKWAILCYAFVVEVANGGLNQYLCNSSGDYAEETLDALKALGAPNAMSCLAEVKATVYGGEPIPSSRSVRCDILFAWEDEDQEQSKDFFDRIDRRLGWCEEVDGALASFILSHLNEYE